MRIRVAIVDDSVFVREALTKLLDSEPRIKVVGVAASGEELLDNLRRWRPDVITLDLEMPGIGGMETLDRIMLIRPTRVVILSTHSGFGAPLTIDALSRGAADFVDKQAFSLVDFDALRSLLMEKILQLASGQIPQLMQAEPDPGKRDRPAWMDGSAGHHRDAVEVVLVGASTGGPAALERFLKDLGDECPVPIAIVQHMPEGFTHAFAERLNGCLPFDVHEARDGESLHGGSVAIAMAGRHLRLERSGNGVVTRVNPLPDEVLHRPSVDVLFESVAAWRNPRAVAVLMTGMGRDGAKGMAALQAAGCHTIAQDEVSSVVFGMPNAAIELNAAREVLPLTAIGARVRELLAPVRPSASVHRSSAV